MGVCTQEQRNVVVSKSWLSSCWAMFHCWESSAPESQQPSGTALWWSRMLGISCPYWEAHSMVSSPWKYVSVPNNKIHFSLTLQERKLIKIKYMWPIKESMCDLGRLVQPLHNQKRYSGHTLVSTPAKTPSFPPPAVSVTFCSGHCNFQGWYWTESQKFWVSDPENPDTSAAMLIERYMLHLRLFLHITGFPD